MLITPAAVVAKSLCGLLDVKALCDCSGLAIVECFEGGEFVCVLLDQVGELHEELAAFCCGDFETPFGLERVVGGFDGAIDVFGGCFGHSAGWGLAGHVREGKWWGTHLANTLPSAGLTTLERDMSVQCAGKDVE